MRNLIQLTTFSRSCQVSTISSRDDNGSTSSSKFQSYDTCKVPSYLLDEAHENNNGDPYLVLTNLGELVFIVNSNDQDLLDHYTFIPRWRIDLNTDADDDTWFQCTFIEEIDAIVCLSHKGRIVKVMCDEGIFQVTTVDDEGPEIEVVGDFEFGINDASWSPDFDVLLLHLNSEGPRNNDDSLRSSRSSALLAMSNTLEIMCETSTVLSPFDGLYAPISISWKGDGSYAVVSCLDDDNIRRIRTYQKADLQQISLGRLETGADVKYITDNPYRNTISWCPNGSLIAAAQVTKRSAQVIFFEPCGLRHREFPLKSLCVDTDSVREIKWNSKSDLLAVCIERTKKIVTDDIHKYSSVVQLWHRDNYHWYIKAELPFSCRVEKLEFHDENPYELIITLMRPGSQCCELINFEFCWDHDISNDDLATAAVIDGKVLHLTPLSIAMVPPPMSVISLEFEHPVRHISFSPFLSTPVSMLVFLSNGDLVFLGDNGENIVSSQCMIGRYNIPKVVCRCNINDLVGIDRFDFNTIRQITLVNYMNVTNSIHVVAFVSTLVEMGGTEKLLEIEISLDSSDTILQSSSLSLENRALRLAHWKGKPGKVIVQLVNGVLLEYEIGSGLIPSVLEPFLEPCPYVSILEKNQTTDSSQDAKGKPVLIGLSRRSRLYFGEHLICNGASSFVLSQSHGFLVYITLGSRSQLRFIGARFFMDWDPYAGSDENVALVEEGYEPRSVERGARLVAISPKSPTAILQMPRGNLEGVVPRALALPFVRSLISDCCYADAFDLMRRQRIDLNLIVDHNPIRFLDECELFIKQVGRTEYLNLFIASLQNYDVTLIKYVVPAFGIANIESSKRNSDFDFSDKVNIVCRKLRDKMMDRDSDVMSEIKKFKRESYLLPILSTFAKETPPKLIKALELIRDVAESTGKSLMSDESQSYFQYLAFLADYDLIYDTALGIYDFDLCKAVARNSQKDPKIYLPQLARLKSLHPLVAKYNVDLQLERYESALIHLFEAKGFVDDHFTQCLILIEKQHLHRLALRLFQNQESELRSIMISLGDSLMNQNKADMALAVYLATKPRHIEGAKRAARACGDWRTFFSCCIEGSNEEIKNIASYIAEEIASGRGGNRSKQEEAHSSARILLDYCDDVEGAIEVLTASALYEESRRIAMLYSKINLLSFIQQNALSYGQSCVKDFEERSSIFEDTNERYAIVLKQQKEMKKAEQATNELIPDNQSLFSAASNMSNASLYSNMSSISTSSATSLSSVISLTPSNTFSLIGDHENKHNSKFNNPGGRKKKKQKKQRKRMKRGSDEEMQQLISTLKCQIVDDEYFSTIVETIKYLAQEDEVILAHQIFRSYKMLQSRIHESQQRRMSEDKRSNEEGDEKISRLDCEDDIDSLACKDLPMVLNELFSYLS